MKVLLPLAGILLAALAGGQQPAAPDNAASPADRAKELAAIEGRTVDPSGLPVRKTNLTLRAADVRPGETPRQSYAATSDADGRFSFTGVEPGHYQLWAEKAGYLRQPYGAKRNIFQGTQLALTAGQHMKDLTFQLTPQAVISGKVVDEDGDPVSRARVTLLRQGFMNGRRQLLPSGTGMSDDDGAFKIGSVAPGRYYLSAANQRGGMFGESIRPPSAESGKPEEDFVTTYYPGVTDATAATPIEVAAGRDVPGTDIRMRKSQVFRVRGKVVGSVPNQSPQRLRVMLMPRDGFGFGFSGVGTGAGNIGKDGAFELTNVQPGAYTIAAVNMEGMIQILARQPLDVGSQTVEGVVLAVQPPADLRGSVKIEGDAKAVAGQNTSPSALRITLTPSDGPAFNAPNAKVNDDGTFVLPNVAPGKYRIYAFGNPDGTYLKSVRLGEQETLDSGLDLSQGAGAGALQIIFSAAAGQIDGTVQNEEKQPVAGGIVTLAPDPPQPDRNYLYRMSTADQNGRFAFKSLAPGKYRVYGWEDLEFGAQSDPEFLKLYEGQSVAVTLNENGHEQVALRRVPAEKMEEVKRNAGR